jgi:hypothetical protein
MLNKIIKNRVWVIITIVVIVSVISSPLTGKGSSSQLWRFYTPILMAIGLPFLYALLSHDMIPLEKIILAPIVGFISLTIITIVYDELIQMLGLYDNEYDRVTNIPMANLVFYVPSVLGAVLCLYLFERLRRREELHRYP